MFAFLGQMPAVRMMHSPDIDDMRRALTDEDDDGPDGGAPNVAALPIQNRRRKTCDGR